MLGLQYPPLDALDAVESSLGEPYYRAPGVLLYRGDCLALMRRLPGELFDLTVTSPPYNIGKAYERARPVSEYIGWCEEWIREIHRLCRPEGAFWLNLGYLSIEDRARAIPIPYLLWDRIPFFLIQEIVWNYGAGVACRTSFSPRNEKFLWYVKDQDSYVFNLDDVRDPDVKYPNQKKNGKLKCNPLGKNPTDVWQFPKVTSGQDRSSVERTGHPAQFPFAVIDRIVRASSRRDDLVFDPFVGSGTTLEVAIRNGRQAVGFEISPAYARIAARRIEDCLETIASQEAQGALFERSERW